MSVSAEEGERGGEGNHISRTGRQAGQGRTVVVGPLHALRRLVAVGRKEGRKELADELKARKIRKI